MAVVVSKVVFQVGSWIIVVFDRVLLSRLSDLGFAQNCSDRLRELNIFPDTLAEIFPAGNMYGGTIRRGN
jgi:hypothetical protein